MTWWKADADLAVNGKIADAGEDGALLYIAVLCLHARSGSNGNLPASMCKASRLRIAAGALLGRMDDARIEAAVDACVENGLLAFSGEGGAISIAGWDEEHMARCVRCHLPNSDPSHGTCPSCREGKRKARADEVRLRSEKLARKGRSRAVPGQSQEQPKSSQESANGALDRTGQDRTGRDSEKVGREGSLSQEESTRGVPYRDPGRIVADVAGAKAVRA